MVGELLEHLVADRPVHDFLGVRRISENERQVEHVELRHERAHRTDADAGDLQGADLRLLDHLLLAAELHGGVHLDADARIGGGCELLAHALHRLDGGIAEGMHVGGLQHDLGLGEGSGNPDRTHGQSRQTEFHD